MCAYEGSSWGVSGVMNRPNLADLFGGLLKCRCFWCAICISKKQLGAHSQHIPNPHPPPGTSRVCDCVCVCVCVFEGRIEKRKGKGSDQIRLWALVWHLEQRRNPEVSWPDLNAKVRQKKTRTRCKKKKWTKEEHKEKDLVNKGGGRERGIKYKKRYLNNKYVSKIPPNKSSHLKNPHGD